MFLRKYKSIPAVDHVDFTIERDRGTAIQYYQLERQVEVLANWFGAGRLLSRIICFKRQRSAQPAIRDDELACLGEPQRTIGCNPVPPDGGKWCRSARRWRGTA